MHVHVAEPLDSPARTNPAVRGTVRVALVQHAWREDADELARVLDQAVGAAAAEGAGIVFLPELTLSKYPAFERPEGRPADLAEDLHDGPTATLAKRAAERHGVHVGASLHERVEGDDLGYNTAILVSPDGTVARTRKLHIPGTDGYAEKLYFRPGPAEDPFPVHAVGDLGVGMPTCYDEWFPEVARGYALAGADLVAYPTAIGSEVSLPGFDSQPQWQAMITSHAIANGLFVVAPNRTGDEGRMRFYGSSFIADPYGRVLARAPRDAEAVLVADLDLDQRRDWQELFPFLPNRRPDAYGLLTRAPRESSD